MSGRGKTLETKIFWAKILAKIGSETRFFATFSHLVLAFVEIAYNDSFQDFLTSKFKRTKKGFEDQLLGENGPKFCPKLDFCYFLKSGSLAFL